MSQMIMDFDRSQTNEERFWIFHKNNPHIYSLLVKYARELKAAGHNKAGVRLLWERMRWDWLVSTTESSPVFNNNYAPFYSRLIMDKEADLQGFLKYVARTR